MPDLIKAAKNEITLDKILASAMKTPGIKINRAKFLKKELLKYYPEEVIALAVKKNPARAGISKKTIKEISNQVIHYETAKVTALSAAASLPGGAAAVPAVAADITSYFAFIFRIIQELAYLYGFQQFNFDGNDVNSETMDYLMLFMGVMFGVQEAAGALKKFADVLAKNVAKKISQKTLMKGSLYPVVKKVSKAVGVRMTKQIFADSVASAIPVISGALSGGLTYLAFKPGCIKLRDNLSAYHLCDPEYYQVHVRAVVK
jgi:hypothetical protein